MAESRALDRQPDKLDYASPTQFKFGIHQLPKVEFFTVAANVPGINLGDAIFPRLITLVLRRPGGRNILPSANWLMLKQPREFTPRGIQSRNL